ncbi:MAG: hypothetical protein EAZ85_06845 [Bacteroidetes bacterium]|nr:MAG: hypothetical protein EAZ85_06845 [Bacteroidota bacterium]TAG89537.1 MAG: hypothetical protein EAZ20_06250 [Bacteroidota bacterium]
MSIKTDPAFVKISENLATDEVLDDLIVEPFNIEIGDKFNIGGRFFSVNGLLDEKGQYKTKECSDLKNNLKTYEELIRTKIIPESFKIDDLYLKNERNSDALIEITIPTGIYETEKPDQILHSNQRSFFARLDSSMLNTKLKEKNIQFDSTEIKLTPCMFASDAALAFTNSQKQISITERNTIIDENIERLEVNHSFTLYEKEIISRLIGTVNLLAYNQKINFITTALPRGAYYTFLFKGAADGFISPKMVLDWFDKVDARVKFLRLIIKKGIHQYHQHIPITQYSFMDTACDMMRKYFEDCDKDSNKKIDLEELLNLVLNEIEQKDSFAKQIFISNIEKPKTFQDLCNFTYSIGNLTNMELKENEKQNFQQIIGVYDVSESMMWTEAKRLRNRGLLEFRGQFNANVPQSTTYDNLSYVSVMPTEHVIFDISPEFAEKYMGGFTRLYSVRENALTNSDTHHILTKNK